MMKRQFKAGVIALCSIMVMLAGCASNKEIVPPPASDDPRLVSDYHVGIGDQLSVQVWKNPELSISVPVRPDGKISVPLVGDVIAAGKYVEELASDITTLLESLVRSPKVTVIVQSPTSAYYLSKVRVTGAVGKPVSLDFKKGMTVFDAIEAAGGVTPFANKKKAELIRTISGEEMRFPIYLNEIFDQGELRTNYDLLPLDMITIPEKVF
jgi:polysaccharide export outer membrane protein